MSTPVDPQPQPPTKEESIGVLRKGRDEARTQLAEAQARLAELETLSPLAPLVPLLPTLTEAAGGDLTKLADTIAELRTTVAAKDEALQEVAIERSDLYRTVAAKAAAAREDLLMAFGRHAVEGATVVTLNQPYVEAVTQAIDKLPADASAVVIQAHLTTLAKAHQEEAPTPATVREVQQIRVRTQAARDEADELRRNFATRSEQHKLTQVQQRQQAQEVELKRQQGLFVAAVNTYAPPPELATYVDAARSEAIKTFNENLTSPSLALAADVATRAAMVPALLARIKELESPAAPPTPAPAKPQTLRPSYLTA